MKTLEFEVPLPPAGTQQNTRRIWQATATAIRLHRGEGATAAAQAAAKVYGDGLYPQPWLTGMVEISLVFHCAKWRGETPVRYRPQDIANAIASMKGAVDGFVDARVIANDTYEHLDWGKVKLLHGKEAGPRPYVAVTLREVGP